MILDEVVEWFGNQNRMARRLGVTRAAVSSWVISNTLPAARAIQIERLTNGEFKAVDLPTINGTDSYE